MWEGWGRGVGREGWGRGAGREGWRSKVRVEPAAPAATVAPLPNPDPPPPRRSVGECFGICEILFRRLLRPKCELSVEPAQGSRSPPFGLLFPVPPKTPRGRPHVGSGWDVHNKRIA